MKNRILIFFTLFIVGVLNGQSLNADLPEDDLDSVEIRGQLEFLASDFLQGRRTNSAGNDIAANYIASQLKAYGFQTPNSKDNYFQKVPLILNSPPTSTVVMVNDEQLIAEKDYLILSGTIDKTTAKAVFAGYGWVDEKTGHNDYSNLNVKGKVVFVLPGSPGSKDPSAIFEAMAKKQAFAKERGAVALFELYQLPFPWEMFTKFFGGESMHLANGDKGGQMIYGWLNKTKSLSFETIQTGGEFPILLGAGGAVKKKASSSNVIGVLPGSDPVLKNEYLLLTAHYDHVGVGEQGGEYTPQDSIFNGARDNGIGVVALLAAAKSLAELRPSRSVIVIALTGEELGLLGSQYYADNPSIPLKDVVFNFNTDGAGYTDISAISIVGGGRTGVDHLIAQGTEAYGLKVITNPVPEMHLFDRSDNVSFAKKGVPCISFSPGFSEFSPELMKNYHQVSDETTDLNWTYITKYCQAFSRTARLLANDKNKPQWVEGDKYEAAGNELYKD